MAAGPAAANSDDDDEADEIEPVPHRSMGLSFLGGSTQLGSVSAGGGGPTVEFAIGRARWQAFGEAGVEWVDHAIAGDADHMRAAGHMVRGGGGLRWIARQFIPDESGAVELFLEGLVGAERFYWKDGARQTRPELALGFGMQVRLFRLRDLTTRISLRVVSSPGESPGFMTGMGVLWR